MVELYWVKAMNNQIYRKRIVEELINKKLRTSGAVLVTGPKDCGKTTTCKMMSKFENSFCLRVQFSLQIMMKLFTLVREDFLE